MEEDESFGTDDSMEKFQDEEAKISQVTSQKEEVPILRRSTFWNPMGGAKQMQGLRKMLTPTSAALEKQDTNTK